MAFASKYWRAITALLVFVSTAVLVWFGNGLNPLWPLLWFAPLPVLIFALYNSWRSTASIAFFSWLAGCLNLWHYLLALHTPFSVWLGVFSLAAVVFASAVLLFRALARRCALWSAMVAFPAAWVSYEYLRDLTTPHGTAGCLAYSQLNFLPFVQLASITGPWGMSFLLLLFPAALALGLHLRNTRPKLAMRVLGTGVGLIALALIFGAIRLGIPLPHDEMTAGLIASDEAANVNVANEGTATERLFHDYAVEAEKLASRGAQVVVLPEKLGLVVAPQSDGTDAIFQRIADKTNSTIVVGQVYVTQSAKYNQARVYAPETSVQRYDKHHMLPPFESNLKPGTTLTLIPKHSETWGVAICKDMDFTPLSRKYGRAGVGLMLVPAWDFALDRWWHGHIAVMRGVEDGFSVVRAAKDGYLTISDDRGRIVAETRSDSGPFARVLGKVPATHDQTLFLLLGDWFAWFSVAILSFTVLRLHHLRNKLTPQNDAGSYGVPVTRATSEMKDSNKIGYDQRANFWR